MINFIFALSPASALLLYKLICYCISIHREMKILNKLNNAGVEHAMVTKDQILF